MSNEGKRPEITVDQLRAQLRANPEQFVRALDALLSRCPNEEAKLFWTSVKKFAESSSKG